MIRVTPAIALDPAEIDYRFLRASGPGGQHVQKVETAVQLRFDAARSPSLPEPVRARLLRLAGRRATGEGVIVITAREERSRERNRAAALARLVALVRQAAVAPKPRRPTAPGKAVRERRLTEKKQRGARKAARRRPGADEG